MRLLMIDDDEDMVSSVRTVMEAEGWDVTSAPNGEEGVRRARELAPDLIILDILMPRKDGLTTYEELRADDALRGIPVIVFTSVSEKLGFSFSASDMADHYGHQPEAFLQKPFEPQSLLAAVRKVVRTGR
jgi:DNA-binding response OmpR family regulator